MDKLWEAGSHLHKKGAAKQAGSCNIGTAAQQYLVGRPGEAC